jgi:hypothetical protein
MKSLRDYISTVDQMQEGAIGAAIGAGLGGVAGSMLGGPIGTALGAAGGSYLGNKIGDWLDPVSKSHETGTVEKSDNGGWEATTSSGVTVPASNVRSSDSNSRKDKYGNGKPDYIKQPKVVSVTANLSLPKGGDTSVLSKYLETRGGGHKIVETWDYNGATLALTCRDEAYPEEGNGDGHIGFWTNVSTLATEGGDLDYMVKYFEANFKGYKLTAKKEIRTSNRMGDLILDILHLDSGLFSREITAADTTQLFAFESPMGKGLHLISAWYWGKTSTYEAGGEKAFQQLIASIEPAANIKPLTAGAGSKN